LWTGAAGVARAGGKAADGKAKAVACAACHTAIAGQSPVPHLAGQRETYLAKQLRAFKSGDRKHPVMGAIAGELGDADIDNLAAYWASLAAGGDANTPPEAAAARRSQMTFPKDFPRGYVQYGTSNNEQESTISKSYINQTGLNAVKAGKPLPDGSVIIVAVYGAKLDSNKKPLIEKDGAWALDGKIKSYAGMEIRAGWGAGIPELLRNGDWNYGVFTPDKAPQPDVNQAQCLACHKPKSDSNYVFLFKDIQAKASGK
jgi:cytochrome c553